MTELLTATSAPERNIEHRKWKELEVPNDVWQDNLPNVSLPTGYGVIGGAARNIAWDVIRDEPSPPLRDIDLVALADKSPDFVLADELAEWYSPDDFRYGHGVQVIEDIDDYFDTRDFTINQVLVEGDRLLITHQAAKDIEDGVIRPTEHEIDERQGVSSRLQLKAVLLQIVFENEGYSIRLEGFGVKDDPHDFELALFLQKSLEYGQAVAHKFWAKLEEHGLIDEELLQAQSLNQRAAILNERLEWQFEYRNEAEDLLQAAVHTPELVWGGADDAWLDEVERWRDKMGSYAGKGARYIDRD